MLASVLVFGFALHGRAGEDAGKKKFDKPVHADEARWQMEKFAGCDVFGHLDGPRLEMQYCSAGNLESIYRPHGAGKYVFSSYDPRSERAHVVAGSARGYLDGPFSRARFGGWDYVTRSSAAQSPDKRYLYMTDGYNGHVLRCFDLEKQEVKTLMPGVKNLAGLVTDSKNRLYMLKSDGQFTIITPDGQSTDGPKVELKEELGGWGASLAMDEKNNRIYGTCYATKNFYIWYWDLKDGSFHGVLPMPKEGGKNRPKSAPGPFEGTTLYSQGSVFFGPDDPERRFLYTGRVDTWNLFRLDLDKKMMAALDIESGGGKKGPAVVKFSYEKESNVNVYGGAGWLEDGSFQSTVHSPFDTWRFLRTK
ncbi:MAG: hypothetical protein C0404_09025 [Verrucomicrobia bacterium]|nr:hypothetical protein [Verrucomicrobiota bacterium]